MNIGQVKQEGWSVALVMCLIRTCDRPVIPADHICWVHARWFRQLCRCCGKYLRHETSMGRGLCGPCWHQTDEARRRSRHYARIMSRVQRRARSKTSAR